MKFRVALLFTLLASFAFAGVIYDRSLDPKSLITWTSTGTYIIGDDIGFAGFSAGDTIGKVTIWVVGENTATTKSSVPKYSRCPCSSASTPARPPL